MCIRDSFFSCQQTRHPSCRLLFIPNSSVRVWYILSSEVLTVLTISYTFKQWHFKTISCNVFMISDVVALFRCPLHFPNLHYHILNTSAYLLTVVNLGAALLTTYFISLRISFGIKPFNKKFDHCIIFNYLNFQQCRWLTCCFTVVYLSLIHI